MLAEFLNHLRRLRGRIIGWGIGIGLYVLMMAWFYDSVIDMGADFEALLDSYPQEMLAFFGNIQIDDDAGWLPRHVFLRVYDDHYRHLCRQRRGRVGRGR
jgi:hypothetical protein